MISGSGGGPIGSGVFRSTDFGANWTLLAGGLSTGSYRGFASNDKLIVAGAFGAGVFYSIDNGEKWTAINNGLTDLTIFDLELNDAYLIAASCGYIKLMKYLESKGLNINIINKSNGKISSNIKDW